MNLLNCHKVPPSLHQDYDIKQNFVYIGVTVTYVVLLSDQMGT